MPTVIIETLLLRSAQVKTSGTSSRLCKFIESYQVLIRGYHAAILSGRDT
jgi:hypothetical protein